MAGLANMGRQIAGVRQVQRSVRGFEGLLGVQRPLLPGRLCLCVTVGRDVPALAIGSGDGGGDQFAGGWVVVKEGAGDCGAGGDGRVGHRERAPLELADDVGDAPQLFLSALPPGLVGCSCLLGRPGGAHSASLVFCWSSLAAARSAAQNDRLHSRRK